MATIIPKKLNYLCTVNPDSKDKSKRLDGLDFHELFEFCKNNNIKYMQVTFEEIIDWDTAPMRNFFHGVIVPAFLEKLNETVANESKPIFTKDEVKEKLKRDLLGYEDGMRLRKTSKLKPHEYMKFINDCERVYYNMFNELYDIREKPKPNE